MESVTTESKNGLIWHGNYTCHRAAIMANTSGVPKDSLVEML